MEQELVHLLEETFSSHEGPRKQAEIRLKELYSDRRFPTALLAVGSNEHIPVNTRQAALLVLKKFVETSWSNELDDFAGQVLISDDDKNIIRGALLSIALSDSQDRKVKSAASLVVSKIATADFPEQWPDLLSNLLNLIPNASDGQLHGALKLLQDLVGDCLNEEQFFKVARTLSDTLFGIAANGERKTARRALAVSVFTLSFDTLEMIIEQHKTAVKGFAEETLQSWMPFFLATLEVHLQHSPQDGNAQSLEEHRGLVALKLQVVKALLRIRSGFSSILSPHSPALFTAVWHELQRLQGLYESAYVESTQQGRLEDADGLPYTLDFLVLEELDFMQACLRAPPVRKELERQLQGDGTAGWVSELLRLAISYGQITTEEEDLWNIDINVFLSEESSVTANYTPRSACADLVVKLGEWIQSAVIHAYISQAKSVFAGEGSQWKNKEATLFVLGALLKDLQEVEKTIPLEQSNIFLEYMNHAVQQPEELLRARGHLGMGVLVKVAGQGLLNHAPSMLENCLQVMINDESEIVKISCVRSLQSYLSAIPPLQAAPLQSTIIHQLADFLSQQDISDLNEQEDVMITLLETLRDAILMDTRTCLNGPGLDLLFTIASHGASNFQLTMIISETFEEIASTLSSTSPETYADLCARVLPSLTAAFDMASMTEQEALTNLAAELLSVLTENGSSPLPQGFTSAVMPKLQNMLMHASDDQLLRSATAAAKSILQHDPEQLFSWHDHDGKSGLEVLLTVIARLLGPEIDDNAAAEVGGLAAEVVDKAGAQRLGPYLGQLLQAVAARVSSAEGAQIIQNLILVFASLTLVSPSDVVEFLTAQRIGEDNGLKIVLSKWLENSVNFAGYDEIRNNIMALSKLYDLSSPLVAAVTVKGDVIVTQSSRIITRSRAKATPTTFTTVAADVKILKILTDELAVPSNGADGVHSASAAGNADDVDDDEDEDGEWEDDDEGGFIDLGSGMTKEALMAFGNEGKDFGAGAINARQDDETQKFLLDWFRQITQRGGFEQAYAQLNEQEQEKLRACLA